MYYVYFLRSIKDQSKTYIGYTTDLKKRFDCHNSGGSVHTAQYMPWELISYVAFATEQKARDFEKYIKIGSGHAFAQKRLW